LIRQIADFKRGLRREISATGAMGTIAKELSDWEVKIVARYYSRLKRTAWVRVIESETVPRLSVETKPVISERGGDVEALGKRIVEIPEVPPNSSGVPQRYTAYVPIGSVSNGGALVRTGGLGIKKGRTVACSACHGKDLRGDGDVPALAGMSPIQVVRQLYQMKVGLRREALTVPMNKVIENLTEEDLVEIAAYVASLTP
jgi:cytochrome c553